MATVNLPNTSKSSADANNFSDVYANDNAIVTQVNGNLDATNLAADAVSTSEIAAASVTSPKLSLTQSTAFLSGDVALTSSYASIITSGSVAAGLYLVSATLSADMGTGVPTAFLRFNYQGGPGGAASRLVGGSNTQGILTATYTLTTTGAGTISAQAKTTSGSFVNILGSGGTFAVSSHLMICRLG